MAEIVVESVVEDVEGTVFRFNRSAIVRFEESPWLAQKIAPYRVGPGDTLSVRSKRRIKMYVETVVVVEASKEEEMAPADRDPMVADSNKKRRLRLKRRNLKEALGG